MKRTILTSLIASLSLFTTVAVVNAASTSPGKNSAYESYSGALSATNVSAPVLTATIAKGKPKRVLEAVATISVTGPAGLTGYNIAGKLEANGVEMELPANPGTNVPGTHGNFCYSDGITAVNACTLTIMGWLDLDAAEAANPGVFKKQQIDVVLSAGAFNAFVGNVSGTVMLGVRMEKK